MSTNWGGKVVYAATRLVGPASVAELQRLLPTLEAPSALGSRHSFRGVADTTGVHVSTADLPRAVEVDAEWAAVTRGRATPYELPVNEHETGAALHDLAAFQRWDLTEGARSGATWTLELPASFGCPFQVRCVTTYSLDAEGGLTIMVEGTNSARAGPLRCLDAPLPHLRRPPPRRVRGHAAGPVRAAHRRRTRHAHRGRARGRGRPRPAVNPAPGLAPRGPRVHRPARQTPSTGTLTTCCCTPVTAARCRCG